MDKKTADEWTRKEPKKYRGGHHESDRENDYKAPSLWKAKEEQK